MAIGAPGQGERTTTGTRTEPRFLGPGAVVINRGKFAVLWHRTPEGRWVGLPIVTQTGPLHRSHVPLSAVEVEACVGRSPPGKSRMLVATGEPVLIAADAMPVGECDISVLIRIKQTIARVHQAIASEGLDDAHP